MKFIFTLGFGIALGAQECADIRTYHRNSACCDSSAADPSAYVLPTPLNRLIGMSAPLGGMGLESYRSGYAAYEGGFPFLDHAFNSTVMSPLDFQQCSGTMVYYAFALNLASLPEWLRASYAIDPLLAKSEVFWRASEVLRRLYNVEIDLGFDMKYVTCELVDNSPEIANQWRDASGSNSQTCKAGSVIKNARLKVPNGMVEQKYLDRVNFTQTTVDALVAELVSYTSQFPEVLVGVAKPVTRVGLQSYAPTAKLYIEVIFVVHLMKISRLMSGDSNHFTVPMLMESIGCNKTTVQTHGQATAPSGGCGLYKVAVANHYDNAVADFWEAYQPYDGTTVWLRADRANHFVPDAYQGGSYTINHHKADPAHRITMSPGKNYTIHVPESHPVAFLVGTTQTAIDAILTVEGTVAGTEVPIEYPPRTTAPLVPDYGSLKFYHGDLVVRIHADAPTLPTASLSCYHHGWMGRKDQLQIKAP